MDQVVRVSKEEFLAGRKVRHGMSSPELMDVPFWNMMIRTGWSAWGANETYCVDPFKGGPTWCFNRMGMTSTVWQEKFVIHIGGEHEDGYDPDFQIYNDVIVRDFEGNIWVYGYPTQVFPPTDFHTATPIINWQNFDFNWRVPDSSDDCIIIIGGIGYTEDREFWRTPVYKLDTRNFSITALELKGPEPGWISKHHSAQFEPGRITVWGGQVLDKDGGFVPNQNPAVLDLWKMAWEEA